MGLTPFEPYEAQTSPTPYQLVLSSKLVKYGSLVNLTLVKTQDETLESFIMTGFDSYHLPVGSFVTEDRYLNVQDCYANEKNKKGDLIYKKSTISNAGPLFQDQIEFQWRAPKFDKIEESPTQVQFYVTIGFVESKVWVNQFVGDLYVV